MKANSLGFAMALLASVLAGGCKTTTLASSDASQSVKQADVDPPEKKALDILQAANKKRREESKARNHYAELQSKILQRKIAILEGRKPNDAAVASAQETVDADRRAGLHPEAKVDQFADMDAMASNLECTDELIKRYNAKFPGKPQAGVADLAEMIAGPLTVARQAAAKRCADYLMDQVILAK